MMIIVIVVKNVVSYHVHNERKLIDVNVIEWILLIKLMNVYEMYFHLKKVENDKKCLEWIQSMVQLNIFKPFLKYFMDRIILQTLLKFNRILFVFFSSCLLIKKFNLIKVCKIHFKLIGKTSI